MGFIVGPAMGPTVRSHRRPLALARCVWSLHPVNGFGRCDGLCLTAGSKPKRKTDKTQLDSLLLITVASACFLTGLSNGPRFGWASANVFTLFLIAACCLAAFIGVELTDRPLLQMRLFRIRTFTVSVLVGFVFGAGMFGSMYVLPIFAQTVLGYTAFKAGLLLMISGLLMVPIFPLGGALAQTPRSGIPISAGMFLFGVSSVVLAGADTYVTFLFVAFWATVGRIGLSIALPALQTGAMRELLGKPSAFWCGNAQFRSHDRRSSRNQRTRHHAGPPPCGTRRLFGRHAGGEQCSDRHFDRPGIAVTLSRWINCPRADTGCAELSGKDGLRSG